MRAESASAEAHGLPAPGRAGGSGLSANGPYAPRPGPAPWRGAAGATAPICWCNRSRPPLQASSRLGYRGSAGCAASRGYAGPSTWTPRKCSETGFAGILPGFAVHFEPDEATGQGSPRHRPGKARCRRAPPESELPDVQVERTRDQSHGDFSSNAGHGPGQARPQQAARSGRSAGGGPARHPPGRAGGDRRSRLHQLLPLPPPTTPWCRRSLRPVRPTAAATSGQASGCRWSSSPPIPPARCTWATAAARPTAPWWRTCCGGGLRRAPGVLRQRRRPADGHPGHLRLAALPGAVRGGAAVSRATATRATTCGTSPPPCTGSTGRLPLPSGRGLRGRAGGRARRRRQGGPRRRPDRARPPPAGDNRYRLVFELGSTPSWTTSATTCPCSAWTTRSGTRSAA